MRAHLVAAVVALAVVSPAVLPAAAAPPDVQEVLAGVAIVHVAGPDRATYAVRVHVGLVDGVATSPDSGVYVWISRCAPACPVKPDRYFSAPLTTAQYDAGDDTRFSVRLTAFGKPFAVTWTATGPAGQRTGLVVGGTTAGANTSSWPASAAITVLGRTCVDAGAGAGRGVVVYGEGRPKPDPANRFPARSPAGVPAKATACRPAPAGD